ASCYRSFLFVIVYSPSFFLFFFHYTSTSDIYTLSLHDALPIFLLRDLARARLGDLGVLERQDLVEHLEQQHLGPKAPEGGGHLRSEEHTSELQSRSDLVCRLLLEKKKKTKKNNK